MHSLSHLVPSEHYFKSHFEAVTNSMTTVEYCKYISRKKSIITSSAFFLETPFIQAWFLFANDTYITKLVRFYLYLHHLYFYIHKIRMFLY